MSSQLAWRRSAAPLSAPHRTPSPPLSSQKPTKADLKPGKRFFLPNLADITSSSTIHRQIGQSVPGQMSQQLTMAAFEHPVIALSYRDVSGSTIVTCHCLTSWNGRRLEDAWSHKPENWTKVCMIEHNDELPPKDVKHLHLHTKSAKNSKQSYVFLWTFDIEVENLRFDLADRHGEVVLDEAAVKHLVNHNRLINPAAKKIPLRPLTPPSSLAPQVSPLLIRRPVKTSYLHVRANSAPF
ncbi:uncharacterized protein BDZ99DRAFT_520939 [Mytilinidion resinicola]|uniref:Uncharacterized protein n=1 Tax=Mytilinidion resinicola TaxID=574789 RepID=A0A6A6YL43_9PEZI|nr:uncharacterized protein BDZ99DRAFT_520939 [Mytilinidion resinicola]KAF2809596.1 hypothetical protein BDZ99DRAFT_520939 [Mytilinidion resinicola]